MADAEPTVSSTTNTPQKELDKIKKLAMMLAGGLIFIFGIIGILDLISGEADEQITEDASNSAVIEDFDTTGTY